MRQTDVKPAVNMNITVFRGLTPCSLVYISEDHYLTSHSHYC
jgi:hypothetical protein